jgi:hypothetical protein
VYDTQDILILHIASSTASTRMRHDSACFSQITMHHFKYVGKDVADQDIDADIPSVQRENFHRKNQTISAYFALAYPDIFVVTIVLEDSHLDTHRRENLKSYHCTCYRYYCPSLKTALQLSVLPRTISAESNDHNAKLHQRKNMSFGNSGESGGKKSCSDFCDLPNNLLKYCTRALCHPVNKIGKVLFAVYWNSKGVLYTTSRAVTSAGCFVDNHGSKELWTIPLFL